SSARPFTSRTQRNHPVRPQVPKFIEQLVSQGHTSTGYDFVNRSLAVRMPNQVESGLGQWLGKVLVAAAGDRTLGDRPTAPESRLLDKIQVARNARHECAQRRRRNVL